MFNYQNAVKVSFVIPLTAKRNWWIRSRVKSLLRHPNWFRLNCPHCRIRFYVDEDWPSRIEQLDEFWEGEDEQMGPYRDFCGLTVFEVFCPSCGQVLRFDKDKTPKGRLNWKSGGK
ncbi:MAG: hypothetical protein JSV35_01040 [Candidatus Bathyarchaeota archaeon]|nr:MAG: hypothetical protein JSV35_01040 [Candidatus Bathyarchaeota archaeon]